MTSAIAGRRVVVTRAAEQSDELIALLQTAGAIPVVIPLIEIVTDEDGVARLTTQNLAGVDWLIVTSPNGAAHVVKAFADQPTASIAAIGNATAEVLRAGGLDVALIPAVQSAAGLLAELPTTVTDSRILLIQAANAEPALADGLRDRGAAVTVVAPYRTVPARVTAGQQLAALSADAVLFASGSSARAWADVFGDAAPPVVVAIGPQTASAATEAGLKVGVVAADHSLSGLIVALESHLSSQR